MTFLTPLFSVQIDRAELIEQIKALRDDNRQIRSIVDEKFKEIQPLQQALGQLRSADNASRNGGLCSSEEELNSRVYFLFQACTALNSSLYFVPLRFLVFFMLCIRLETDPGLEVYHATWEHSIVRGKEIAKRDQNSWEHKETSYC